jgi:hypothetical protein
MEMTDYCNMIGGLHHIQVAMSVRRETPVHKSGLRDICHDVVNPAHSGWNAIPVANSGVAVVFRDREGRKRHRNPMPQSIIGLLVVIVIELDASVSRHTRVQIGKDDGVVEIVVGGAKGKLKNPPMRSSGGGRFQVQRYDVQGVGRELEKHPKSTACEKDLVPTETCSCKQVSMNKNSNTTCNGRGRCRNEVSPTGNRFEDLVHRCCGSMDFLKGEYIHLGEHRLQVLVLVAVLVGVGACSDGKSTDVPSPEVQ